MKMKISFDVRFNIILILPLVFTAVALGLFFMATRITDPAVLLLFYTKYIACASALAGFFFGILIGIYKSNIIVNIESNNESS